MKTLFKLCFIFTAIILSNRPAETFATTSNPAFSEDESTIHLSYLPVIDYSADGNRSSFRVFNPGASEATITWTAYNEDGSVAMSNADSIPAGSSRDYWPMPNGTDDFAGSVVIASDQPIGVISTLHAHDGSSIASYTGVTEGAKTVFIPYLLKNADENNTWYSVQNISDSLAYITNQYSPDLTELATIPAGGSKRFYQSNQAHTLQAFMGMITSDQPIIVTVITSNGASTSAYHGVEHPMPRISFPIIETEHRHRTTIVAVGNVSSLSSDVTVTHMPNSGIEPCIEKHSIAPASLERFVFSNFRRDCLTYDPTVGPGRITENSAEQSFVSTVSQVVYKQIIDSQIVSYEQSARASYTPIASNDATDTVVMPLIMDHADGYYTRFSIQHIGGPAATVTCKFSDSERVIELALDKWASLQDIQWNQIGNQYIGSAICQADNNKTRIAAVVTQENLCLKTDQFASYTGIAGDSSTITISPSVDANEPYAPLWLDKTSCVLYPPTDPTVGVIAGSVVDTIGRPLGVRKIFAFHQDDNGEWVVANSQEIDRNGNYRITLDSPVSSYRLGFYGAEDIFYYGSTYAVEEATDISVKAGETTAINIVIEQVSLSGKVTDSNGNPLENVEVNALGRFSFKTWTDADGNYEFFHLPDGIYSLYATGYDHYLDTLVEGITVKMDHITIEDMTLETGGRIEGTIDVNHPLSHSYDTNIQIYNQNDTGEWVEVGRSLYEDGLFSIRLAEGTYRLRFIATQNPWLSTFHDSAYAIENATDLIVTQGQTTMIEQTMGQYNLISGNVVDISGQPLSDISVYVYKQQNDGEWTRQTTEVTDVDGHYQTSHRDDLTPGNYRVEFYANERLAETVSDIALSLSQTRTVDAVIDSVGHISGQFTDSSGAPISGATVIAYTPNADGEWKQANLGQTDAEGNYLIQNLLEGVYRIKFDPGSSQAYLATFYGNTESIEEASNVSVISGQATMNVDIVPFETSRLMGQVTDRASNPLGEILISLTRKSETGEWEWFLDSSERADSEGNYVFYNLPEGLYRLHATGRDYYLSTAIEDLEVVGRQHTVADVVLDKGGRIEGTANTYSYWVNLHKILIYSRNDDDIWEQVGTESYEEGKFSIRIAEGTYRLKFLAKAQDRLVDTFYGNTFIVEEATDVTVVTEEVTFIEAELSEGAKITGLVTDYTGTPISALNVTLYQQDEQGQWSERYTNYSGTDNEGRYTMARLGAGLYRIGSHHFGDPLNSEYLTTFHNNALDLEHATDIMISRPQTVTADFMINRYSTVSGQVTNSDGQGIQDISVVAHGYDICTGRPNLESDWYLSDQTDDLGNYEIAMESDTYTFRFHGEDEYLSQYYSQTNTVYQAQQIVLGLNQTVTGIDAQLEDLSSGGTISGYVTSLDGTPLHNVPIIAMRYDEIGELWQEDQRGWAGETGAYIIRGLISGTYRLLFNEIISWSDYGIESGSKYYGGGMSIETGTDITVGEGQVIPNINVSLPSAGNITGQITDEAGSILRHGRIHVYSYDPATEDKHYLDRLSEKWEGSYSLSRLMPGAYLLAASDQSHISEFYNDVTDIANATVIEVAAGETVENINLALTKSATITGQISLEDMKYFQCVEISAYREDDTEVKIFESMDRYTDGTFVLGEGLLPGDYRLQFTDTSGNYEPFMSEMITVKEGEVAGAGNITLIGNIDEPTATLTSTPIPTDTPTPTAVPTQTPTLSATPVDTPTATPIPTDTPAPTAVPTQTPMLPTATPVDTPTATLMPTNTPAPTAIPTQTPVDTQVPTVIPTDDPVPTSTLIPATITGSIEAVESEIIVGDVGRWSINITNTGEVATEYTFLVADLPEGVAIDISSLTTGWECEEEDATEKTVSCHLLVGTLEPGNYINVILAVVISPDFTSAEIQTPSVLVQGDTTEVPLNSMTEIGNNIVITSPEILVEGLEEVVSYLIYFPLIAR